MRPESYSGGPVGKLITKAAEIATRVDIITFNHDLVIENDIYKRKRLRERWCIHKSYGTFGEGRTYLETKGVSMFPIHSDKCDHMSWSFTRCTGRSTGGFASGVESRLPEFSREMSLNRIL